MAAHVCGSPYHVGDPLVHSDREIYERRIEYRRLTPDQGRERVILTYHACRSCMEAETRERRGAAFETASLFEGDER